MFKKAIVLCVALSFCALSFGAGNERDNERDIVAGNERDVIAWCLFVEARGEDLIGKRAVLTVIHNRKEFRRVPIEKIIFAPHQFSGVGAYVPLWFREGPDGKRWPKKHAGPLDRDAWYDCQYLGALYASGNFRPSGTWSHYYAHKLCRPAWAAELYDVRKVGSHTFGTLPGDKR